MTRAKRTEGEKIAMEIAPEGTIAGAIWRKRIAGRIDRAIRRAQAKAWTEGHLARLSNRGLCENPFRGRKR